MENPIEGIIKCPKCFHVIIMSTKGCNVVTCTNHAPYLHFCFHCKKECSEGYATCQCSHRNNTEARAHAQILRNARAKHVPIALLDDETVKTDDADNHEEDVMEGDPKSIVAACSQDASVRENKDGQETEVIGDPGKNKFEKRTSSWNWTTLPAVTDTDDQNEDEKVVNSSEDTDDEEKGHDISVTVLPESASDSNRKEEDVYVKSTGQASKKRIRSSESDVQKDHEESSASSSGGNWENPCLVKNCKLNSSSSCLIPCFDPNRGGGDTGENIRTLMFETGTENYQQFRPFHCCLSRLQ